MCFYVQFAYFIRVICRVRSGYDYTHVPVGIYGRYSFFAIFSRFVKNDCLLRWLYHLGALAERNLAFNTGSMIAIISFHSFYLLCNAIL